MSALPKGIILAAGLGTRLKPFTLHTPKPLLPFFGVAPLHLALWRLREMGLTSCAVNAHHFPEQIKAAVKSQPLGLDIRVQHEPTLLGSGGVYAGLAQWIDGDPVLSFSGDIVTDVDLAELWHRHRQIGADATMCLTAEHVDGTTPVYVADNLVIAIGELPPLLRHKTGMTCHTFTSIQVLGPKILGRLPTSGGSSVIDKAYLPHLADGNPIGAYIHDGIWFDVGTPDTYLDAHMEILSELPSPVAHTMLESVGVPQVLKEAGVPLSIFKNSQTIIIGSPKIGRAARLGPKAVIMNGTVIGANAIIESSILLPGATIAAKEEIFGEIISREEAVAVLGGDEDDPDGEEDVSPA